MSKVITGLNINKIIDKDSLYARTETPTIISPLTGKNVISLTSITAITNNFKTINGTDTHIKSNWKLTNDFGGDDIVESDFDSNDLTAHTFDDLSLTIGNKYYIHAQHVGQKYGNSNWSYPIMFVGTTTNTERGFALSRSPNDISTIVTYKSPADGETDMKMEVIDAAYRANKCKFGTFKKNTSLKDCNTIGAHGGWYFNDTVPTVDCQEELPPDYNATNLYANWSNLKNDLSAKENCDVWMTFTDYTDSTALADGGPITGVPAVQYARGLTVDGGGWQVPNMYQLIVIFLLSEEIDALDPTAFANPTKALGRHANPAGRFVFDGENAAWSSTEYNADRVRYMYSNGLCDHNRKFFGRAVIPIREITNEESEESN